MKKVLFRGVILLISVSLFVVGCKKVNQSTNVSPLANARLESFFESDIVQIGDLHNEWVVLAIVGGEAALNSAAVCLL